VFELIGGFGPTREGFGVDADLEIFAKDGYLFAEVEAGAKFGECGVALLEVGNGGWREEPRGEGIFAHAGAGEREEFEETAGAEEVEIGGVEAGVGVDAFAGLASARPAVFDAGEALAVEVYGAFGAGAAA
jgi:hypothetical protein